MMNNIEHLLEIYNVPVPRYTSYPPANFFHDEFNSDRFVKAIDQSNSSDTQQISLYFHVPFCNELCFYCGCNTHISKDKKLMREYFETLKKELIMIKSHLNSDRKVSQVHWGGGTPNYMPFEWIEEMMNLIHSEFSLIENPEIAMECHPAHLTKEYLSHLIESGINRISLGIQDFNSTVLKTVNRRESRLPMKELVEFIRQYPQVSLNFDFIYGLPYQTQATFTETIKEAINYQPDRIVTFSYAHVPWLKPSQKVLEKHGLPSTIDKFNLYQTAYQLLLDSGYGAIGLDHFAKENDQLYVALNKHQLHRNFQGYCTHETTGQVYAIGVTGISQLDDAYSQNTKNIKEYMHKINSGEFAIEKGYSLNRKEKIIRNVINELMCNQRLNWNKIASSENSNINEIKTIVHYSEEKLKSFMENELIEQNKDQIIVTEIGRGFIRNIASTLDPNYLKQEKRFSKSI